MPRQDSADRHDFAGSIFCVPLQLRNFDSGISRSDATRVRRDDAEAHESLGRALSELGKSDEAAAHLREALRILRSTPAAR
jgi:tetratricopeptide (TPR) repeat protein